MYILIYHIIIHNMYIMYISYGSPLKACEVVLRGAGEEHEREDHEGRDAEGHHHGLHRVLRADHAHHDRLYRPLFLYVTYIIISTI